MNAEFIEALREIVKEKGIEEQLLFDTVEDALVSAYKKNYAKVGGNSQNVKVTIDRENGEIHVYAQKRIEEDPLTINEISLEEAREINPKYEMGDIVDLEVTPKSFGSGFKFQVKDRSAFQT